VGAREKFMSAKKPADEKPGRVKIEDLKAEARELTNKEKKKVKGGVTPTPSGPVPIPYPNTKKD
jgi:hypothetical protein